MTTGPSSHYAGPRSPAGAWSGWATAAEATGRTGRRSWWWRSQSQWPCTLWARSCSSPKGQACRAGQQAGGGRAGTGQDGSQWAWPSRWWKAPRPAGMVHAVVMAASASSYMWHNFKETHTPSSAFRAAPDKCQTRWLTQHEFICHTSRGWEGRGPGTCMVRVCGGLAS